MKSFHQYKNSKSFKTISHNVKYIPFNNYLKMIFYTNIYVNVPQSVIKHIVGKGGSNFIKLSQKCNLKSMWYNKDTNSFTLYGDKDILDSAKKYICTVIEGYVKKFANDFKGNVFNLNTMDESCTQVILGLPLEDVKHLIGSEGANLKAITKKSNVYFIWYNAETHAMNVWGTKYHTLQAIKMLQQKCQQLESKKLESKEKQEKQEKLECQALEPPLKKPKLT